jgi:hypothetical protein
VSGFTGALLVQRLMIFIDGGKPAYVLHNPNQYPKGFQPGDEGDAEKGV